MMRALQIIDQGTVTVVVRAISTEAVHVTSDVSVTLRRSATSCVPAVANALASASAAGACDSVDEEHANALDAITISARTGRGIGFTMSDGYHREQVREAWFHFAHAAVHLAPSSTVGSSAHQRAG